MPSKTDVPVHQLDFRPPKGYLGRRIELRKIPYSEPVCRSCGEALVGDGYTSVLACPNAMTDFMEPDACPVYCLAPDI